MRTLVVGDVHGCARELCSMVETARADRIILAGDLFTKGPDPAGVWELIERFEMEAVLGNHDARVLESSSEWRRRGLPHAALEWLSSLPLWIDGDGWRVLHAGCDPDLGAEQSSRQTLLNVRRWPDDRDQTNPFWWELYRGERLLVFGHDAKRGLVDRRPHALGLDTGCVYGGVLTGVLLETGELLEVAARMVYRTVD